jgi:hypothetical protein
VNDTTAQPLFEVIVVSDFILIDHFLIKIDEKIKDHHGLAEGLVEMYL